MLTQRIKATDPFFAPPWEIESRVLAARGDYKSAEESLKHARSILQLDPEAGLGLLVLALLNGEPERAKTLAATVHEPAHRAWGLALAAYDLGDVTAAREALADFVAKSPYEYSKLAAAYARQRKTDAAFAALERAYQTRDPDIDEILIDPLLANLRDDARYGAMLTRLGFPESPGPHRRRVYRNPPRVTALCG